VPWRSRSSRPASSADCSFGQPALARSQRLYSSLARRCSISRHPTSGCDRFSLRTAGTAPRAPARTRTRRLCTSRNSRTRTGNRSASRSVERRRARARARSDTAHPRRTLRWCCSSAHRAKLPHSPRCGIRARSIRGHPHKCASPKRSALEGGHRRTRRQRRLGLRSSPHQLQLRRSSLLVERPRPADQNCRPNPCPGPPCFRLSDRCRHRRGRATRGRPAEQAVSPVQRPSHGPERPARSTAPHKVPSSNCYAVLMTGSRKQSTVRA